MNRTDIPPLNSGDTCSVDPVPPCLNWVGEAAATQPDNTALWGIFLIGLAAGFVLAFVTTARSLYKMGKVDGYAKAVIEASAATRNRPLRNAHYVGPAEGDQIERQTRG